MENKEWKGLSKGDDNTHHGFDKFFIKFIESFKKLTRQTTTFFVQKSSVFSLFKSQLKNKQK